MLVSSSFRKAGRGMLLACVLSCGALAGFAGSADAMSHAKPTFMERLSNFRQGVKTFYWPTKEIYFEERADGNHYLRPLNGLGVPAHIFGGKPEYKSNVPYKAGGAQNWVYGARAGRIAFTAAVPVVLGGLVWGAVASNAHIKNQIKESEAGN